MNTQNYPALHEQGATHTTLDYHQAILAVRAAGKLSNTQHSVRVVLTLWPTMEAVLMRIADYADANNMEGLLARCMVNAHDKSASKRSTLGQDVGVTYCRAYLDGLLDTLIESIPDLDRQYAIASFALPESHWLYQGKKG